MNHAPTVPQLLIQIVAHTPVWVWGVLALLIGLGLMQWRERKLSRTRVAVMPLVLAIYSLWGAVSAFGATAAVLAGWTAGALLLALACSQLPWAVAPQRSDAPGRVVVPGSPWPLILMLAIFATRYVVAVTHILQPGWASHGLGLPLAGALVYGGLSGVLAGRAWRLLGVRLHYRGGRAGWGADAA